MLSESVVADRQVGSLIVTGDAGQGRPTASTALLETKSPARWGVLRAGPLSCVLREAGLLCKPSFPRTKLEVQFAAQLDNSGIEG